MKQYIGTKMIEAEPENLRWQNETGEIEEESGYRVRYPDGYESWSPRDVFEKAYLPLECNHTLRTKAPSISEKMVDDFILETWTHTLGDKTTVVRAMLRNGFEIVESSACVSAENYDEKLGREICMEKIRDKVWFLLGFLLQTAVHGIVPGDRAWEEPGAENMTFGAAIDAAKEGAKIARRGWNGKGQYVELASCIAYTAPDGQVVHAEHEAIGSQAFAFVGTSGVQLGWLASQADMLAEDWQIVE